MYTAETLKVLLLQTEEFSKCLRKKVGCIVVCSDGTLLAGTNKVSGVCANREGSCGCDHAEVWVLDRVRCLGRTFQPDVLICTMSPCTVCAKDIIDAGINRVFFREYYRDRSGLDLLERERISCECLE